MPTEISVLIKMGNAVAEAIILKTFQSLLRTAITLGFWCLACFSSDSEAFDVSLTPTPSPSSHKLSETSLIVPLVNSSNTLSPQQELFKQALKELGNSNLAAFKALQTQLKDYVLAPYLEQAYWLKHMTFAHRSGIQNFLDTYGSLPVAIPVRYRFLKLLARKNQTALFLIYFRPTNDTSLRCDQLRFRLKTKESKEVIFREAEPLWLFGKSRPKACDPVFAAMEKFGALTEELIWQRLLLALKNKKSSLVRYLTSKLGSEKKALGQLAQSALRDYRVLLNKRFANSDPDAIAQVANIVINQLVWREPDTAITFMEKLPAYYNFNYSQKRMLARSFALSLATQDHPRAADWLNNIPADEQDELLLRWKLTHELRKGNWTEVKNWIQKMPTPKSFRNAWQYWESRAFEEIGQSQEAEKLLADLATRRSYYGFLASARLGKKPQLQAKNYLIDETKILALAGIPSVQRARELLQLKKHLSARREWNRSKRSLAHSEKQHLAVLAHRWGWHDQAIFGFAETKMHDAVSMRFPIAFRSTMQKAATQQRLDLSFSLAIARQESAFRADARSPAGAVGLMQIMPNTAKYLTKANRLPRHYTKNLTDPKINIELGTVYLRELLDRHQGNAILAAASYNAGKGRVADWIKRQGHLPADIWIETVPFSETRAYIKNVLAYQQIYQNMLGKRGNLFEQLVALEIGAPTEQTVNPSP